MEALMNAATKAVGSIFVPGMLKVFVWSVLLSIAVLCAFAVFGISFFSNLGHHMTNVNLAHMWEWGGSIVSIIVAWLLFPAIMPVIVNFFDDRIVYLIERHDYPTAPVAIRPAFWPEFWHDMRFSLKAILLNIVVLPLYLVPVVNLFLFYLLNGYLLGREFFVMVARQHIAVRDAEAMRKTNGRIVLAAGILLAFLATIPVINLFAPFWGIAVMTHLYHSYAGTPKADILLPAV